MLDSVTKKRINDLRNILVGKIPDPKSQIEQITTGLIYKFMYDMDVEADKMEGVPSFFVGDYEKYSWENLFDPKLGGEDKVKLYSDAIENMYTNPTAPPLFREIFKNSFLPFKDLSTLNMFLKEINEFHYSHSEKLGDAYEHLLSFMGSQGGAGQFRTPRHIIDFIVEIVNPQKNETILDPACGTAGFLISSFKHILTRNTNKKPGDKLTAAERKQIGENLVGYDISPDMTRISLVNMFLHQFKNPQIHEYDTLSSEDRWNEYYDVILANPPFFSPTGGIQPHSRFGVQSKRAEVLFVDYIMEHLKPNGRAGIVVPEGIIFKMDNAYKTLRKPLVEDYLVAVVSLPAGVFNPYSPVKTSILILDHLLAQKTDRIAFFKVEQDGFDLGAKRTPIDRNDLPKVQAELTEYLNRLRVGEPAGRNVRRVAEPQGEIQRPSPEPETRMIAEKAKIAADGEYNLSGERYRESGVKASEWPMVALGEVCDLVRGVTYSKADEVLDGGQRILRANNIQRDSFALDLSDIKHVSETLEFSDDKRLLKDDVFICLASGSKSHIGKVAFIEQDTDFFFGGFMGSIRVKQDLLHPRFLYWQLRDTRFNDFLREQIAGANINNLSAKIFYRYQIPLPPLEVQQSIIAEIEGHQKIIDGCRQVVGNYKPIIEIVSIWQSIPFPESCSVVTPPSKIQTKYFLDEGLFPVIDQSKNIIAGFWDESKDLMKVSSPVVIFGDHTRHIKYVDFDFVVGADGVKIFRPNEQKFLPKFFFYILKNLKIPDLGYSRHFRDLKEKSIPCPPLKIQKQIVKRLEQEKEIVEGNKKFIEIYTQKIQNKINKVWSE